VGLNRYTAADISDQITKYRTFPDSLFIAPDTWKTSLRRAMSVP